MTKDRIAIEREPTPTWIAVALDELGQLSDQNIKRLVVYAHLEDDTGLLLDLQRVTREGRDAWLQVVDKAEWEKAEETRREQLSEA